MDITNPLFDEKQPVVWWKTTRRLTKNNTLFDKKNDTSFDEKQHVVWRKTTRRLMKNITSFKKEQVLAYPTRPTRVRATSALPFIQQMWNSSRIPLSTRAYTGVLSFLLSQVSQVTSYFLMFQYIITKPKTYFNKQATQPLKIGLSQQRETHFSPFPLTVFLHLFLLLFPPCVTLVTAKKQNCC